MCKLFNNILNTRHFPELWVQSIIIPVFKKGNINEPKTYRGISLVDYVRKLYSRHCLIGGYYKYNGMNNDSVLTDTQFCFRPGFGTTDAFIYL